MSSLEDRSESLKFVYAECIRTITNLMIFLLFYDLRPSNEMLHCHTWSCDCLVDCVCPLEIYKTLDYLAFCDKKVLKQIFVTRSSLSAFLSRSSNGRRENCIAGFKNKIEGGVKTQHTLKTVGCQASIFSSSFSPINSFRQWKFSPLFESSR